MNQPTDINSLPAMVSLPIGRWNQVLEVLGTKPWAEVNALIVDIHRQIEGAVQQSQAQTPSRMDMAA